MLTGNTPRGSSTAADVAAVDSIYGKGAAIRLYSSGSIVTPPVTDRSIVTSFKSTSGATKALLDKYPLGAFFEHEIDSKIKKGQTTLSAWKSSMATLQALGSSSLAVCVTADCFVNSSKNPSDYLISGITKWGVDFDGLSFSDHYHDYTNELNAVKSFASAHGLTIGVAEFGANRAGNDPTGTVRARWMADWMRAFEDAGFAYGCFWEQTSQTGSTFDTPAETAAVQMALAL